MSPWPGTIAWIIVWLAATAAVCFLLYFPDKKLGEDATMAKGLFGMLILAAGGIISVAILLHYNTAHCNEILERMRNRCESREYCDPDEYGGYYPRRHHNRSVNNTSGYMMLHHNMIRHMHYRGRH